MLVYKIHPAIGVARVGNSDQAFFVGPEVPGEPGVEIAADGTETPLRQYKAADGIKRQAVRFRVLEYEKDGATGALTFKREVTSDEATITWKVDLVNRKAALTADQVPPRGIDPRVAPRARNTDLTGADRDGLVIHDPREHTISLGQPPSVFDQGKFLGKLVYLGELRTDLKGRLLVLGGRGISGSVPPGEPITGFANNRRWHDDVSDGPVTATIALPGQPARAVDFPAWITVAPPDFAPGLNGIVTLYDVAFQAGIEAGFLKPDPKPSFRRHILPLIQRAAALRFVNDFQTWDALPRNAATLADPNPDPTSAASKLRQSIFEALMPPNIADKLEDAVVPDFLVTYFQQYVAGDFVTGPSDVPKVSVSEQLDRAALEACVGLNFFPGIEASLNMRHKSIYKEAFRFDPSSPEVFPGFLTQVMAVPWQADFTECAGGWWPSQRPDIVMRDAANVPASQGVWAVGINRDEDMVEGFRQLPFITPVSVNGATVFAQEKP